MMKQKILTLLIIFIVFSFISCDDNDSISRNSNVVSSIFNAVIADEEYQDEIKKTLNKEASEIALEAIVMRPYSSPSSSNDLNFRGEIIITTEYTETHQYIEFEMKGNINAYIDGYYYNEPINLTGTIYFEETDSAWVHVKVTVNSAELGSYELNNDIIAEEIHFEVNKKITFEK